MHERIKRFQLFSVSRELDVGRRAERSEEKIKKVEGKGSEVDSVRKIKT